MLFLGLFRSTLPTKGREELRAEITDKLEARSFNGAYVSPQSIVLVGIDEPRELGLYREGDDFSPPFDIAVKGDFPDPEAFGETLARSGLSSDFAISGLFQTSQTVKKAASSTVALGRLPGVHMLHPLRFHQDLPSSAIIRSWRDIHGDLAIRAHSGAESYNQLLTVSVFEANCTPYGGFSEFHFPSMQALFDGYFASDEARSAVRHDIRHFIDGIPPRMFATAYRIS